MNSTAAPATVRLTSADLDAMDAGELREHAAAYLAA